MERLSDNIKLHKIPRNTGNTEKYSVFSDNITDLIYISVKNEIVGSIQQFLEDNEVIQSLSNDLNYVTKQRYQLVNMWFSRMVERKNDWNQTRTDMKDKLTGKRVQMKPFPSSGP